ncbi:MAG TPA: hypothetical protein VG755_34625 [Nannocystaceae bacterium]|nr:hypothetical protein [Nannocystaceae bacterium]
MERIDPQWSRSAQAIACVLLGAWLLAQLVVSYAHIVWLGLGLAALLVFKIVSVVVAHVTKREPDPPDGLFFVLGLDLLAEARPIHAAVVFVLLLALRFTPPEQRRACAASIALAFVALAILQPPPYFAEIQIPWAQLVYRLACGLAALPFLLFALARPASR